jgi:putative oxidoreductase
MSGWRMKTHDLGLLVLRLGIGAQFAFVHGWPKIQGGPGKWAKLGKSMKHVGVTDYTEFFGAAAAWTEFAGGLLLMVGLLVRPSAFLLACTMAVATAMHLGTGDGWSGASHAFEVGVACLGLTLLGGGRFGLDSRLFSR